VAACLVLVPLAGCVVDGALDASGGGRLRLRYRLVSVADFERGKPRWQSPDVTLVAASMTPDKWATYEVQTADVRTLPSVPSLARTTVALADEPDGTRTLTVTMAALPKTLPEQYFTYLGRERRFSLELPGYVVRSNATTTAGRTVTWTRPLDDLVEDASVQFTVTYRPAA
jgi:hypothetical protein